MRMNLFDYQFLAVTGKGGVGTTSVAAAIAIAGARTGRSVLLCEVEPGGGAGPAVGVDAVKYDPTPSPVRGVSVMAMDTERSVRDFVKVMTRVPLPVDTGPLARILDFVASAAPGVREILTVGKLAHEVRERTYDLVVMDGPPTGHIVGHLAATEGVVEIAGGGLLGRQASWMREILHDPARTAAIICATPEELPVAEAIDLRSRIADGTGVAVAGYVLNSVRPPALPPDVEAAVAALATGHAQAEPYSRALDAAVLAGSLRHAGARSAARLRAAADVPVWSLPLVTDAFTDAAVVLKLAEALVAELDL
jgi:anion-transporting  ArsA/GET3 family ATPase